MGTTESNKVLGYRTLSVVLRGKRFRFGTYSYTNYRGEGDADVQNEISSDSDFSKWFFVYFGYSKLNR